MAPSDAALPDRLGRYRILERLGRGGMGQVYRAVAEGPEGFRREVAVKVVLSGGEKDALRRKMFRDEARVLARLSHPGIAQVFDFGVDEAGAYLVMELVRGHSLLQILQEIHAAQRPMPSVVAMAIGCQVAAALAYAHEATDENGAPMGLVHRDVSPDNLIVTDEGYVKLLDFGIVKAAGREVETQMGLVKGKPAYMAPEQARGLDLDGRADVFGLGVILWECLAGRKLWRGQDLAGLVGQLLHEPIPHLFDVAPQAHPAAAEAVMRLVEKERDARPTAAEAQTILSRAMSAQRSGTPPEIVSAWRRGAIPDEGTGAGWSGPRAQAHAVLEAAPTSEGGTESQRPDPSGPVVPASTGLMLDPASLGADRIDDLPLELAYDPVPPAQSAADAEGAPDTAGTLARAAPETSPGEARSHVASAPVWSARAPSAGERTPAPRRLPWRLIGMAGAGLLVVGLGVVLWFLYRDPGEAEASTGSGMVQLRIETDPPGARLTVDGHTLPETSPTVVQTLALREHRIRAEKEGYVATETTVAYDQIDRPIRLHLDPLLRVDVSTTPAGARVLCNGEPVIEATPGHFTRPPGRYRLTARLEGYAQASTVIDLSKAPATWTPTLVRAALVHVTTIPSGARLLVDGVPVEATSPATLGLPPRKTAWIEARKGRARARKKVRAPAAGKRLRLKLRLTDPIQAIDRKLAALQDEADRLADLVASTEERMDTGILSSSEVRQLTQTRDHLQRRLDAIQRRISTLEDRRIEVERELAEASRDLP